MFFFNLVYFNLVENANLFVLFVLNNERYISEKKCIFPTFAIQHHVRISSVKGSLLKC